MRTLRKPLQFIFGTLILVLLANPVSAQHEGQPTPCGIAIGSDPRFTTHGLTPVAGGLVYDSNQGLCWLADANLAGDPVVREWIKTYLSPANPDPDQDGVTLPVISPDGTMNYETAINWVQALNRFNDGKGWMNHNDWQLPTTVKDDSSCSSENNGNFGVLCTASALANLYNIGLARVYPDSVVPNLRNFVWPFFNVSPFFNLRPGLYWSRSSQGDSGYSTFSFNTGDTGANTTNYNFLHVLPMTKDLLGPIPSGPGVVRPYTRGPGAGKAVYDSITHLSWPLDANLAANNNFGFTSTIKLDTAPMNMNVNHTAFPMTLPMIDKDGSMHLTALCDLETATDKESCPDPPAGWIVSMNNQVYSGSSNWKLPRIEDLVALYADLDIQTGDVRLESETSVGPFWRLQSGFYWSCPRDSSTTSNQAQCDFSMHPGFAPGSNMTPMQYSFNFDDGFLGTDKFDKLFYVMIYFPAPSMPH